MNLILLFLFELTRYRVLNYDLIIFSYMMDITINKLVSAWEKNLYRRFSADRKGEKNYLVWLLVWAPKPKQKGKYNKTCRTSATAASTITKHHQTSYYLKSNTKHWTQIFVQSWFRKEWCALFFFLGYEFGMLVNAKYRMERQNAGWYTKMSDKRCLWAISYCV